LKRNYVILEDKFNDNIFSNLLSLSGSIANASRLTKISKSALGRFFRKEKIKIRIDFVLKIINFLRISLEDLEKNIIWIGANNSEGINKPKLPFDFNSREGARFLAAICNDGWISDGAYYSNTSQSLRDSVRNDTISVFGGSKKVIKEWFKDNDQYLSFPSIIRDVLILITGFKGVKSENNPPIPSFILENKEMMLGWIEQTIADEGCVEYYPKTYRREIVWKRSFQKDLDTYKLHEDEKKILNKLGIIYNISTSETYKTQKNIEKIKIPIRIAKRENMLKLRKLIKIPDVRKDKTFTEMFNGFKRYKEPLRIKEKIIETCRERDYITAMDLAHVMNYKQISNSYKWLNNCVKEGTLVCSRKHHYKKGYNGPVPAKYKLNKP
jgi:hypothetical protein